MSTNASSLLERELGWESMESRRQRHKLFTFFKIVKGEAPTYLVDMLPSQNYLNPAYKGRKPLGFRNYKINKNIFRNSFFPSCIQVWNSLDASWHSVQSICEFKMLVNKKYQPSPPPPYYGQGDRWSSVLHTRLRLGHNTLNRHLHRIGVRETPSCECGFPVESEVHYLLQCPLFEDARAQLLVNLKTLLGPDSNMQHLCTQRSTYFTNLLLNGSSEFTTHQNSLLFTEVMAYIRASRRFAVF